MSRTTMLLAVGVVVALIAVVAAVIDIRRGTGRKPGWAYALAVVAAVGGCGQAAAQAVWDAPPPPHNVRITHPSPAGAEPQPWCVTMRIDGDLPDHRTVAVAVREKDDPRYYYEGDVARNEAEGVWTVSLRLGVDAESSVGDHFDIYVVGLDADVAEYLVNTNENTADTWWSAPDEGHVPPTGQVLDQMPVLRSQDTTSCA